jgi:hypothetical protein
MARARHIEELDRRYETAVNQITAPNADEPRQLTIQTQRAVRVGESSRSRRRVISLPAGFAGARHRFHVFVGEVHKAGPVILTREATPERRAFER